MAAHISEGSIKLMLIVIFRKEKLKQIKGIRILKQVKIKASFETCQGF